MGGLIHTINTLIPFADPTRPIWQDAIYSLFICTFLYFAPNIPFARIWDRALARIQIPTHRDTTLQPGPTIEEAVPQAIVGEPQTRQEPPQPTVEDDIDSSDSDGSLNEDDLAIARLIHEAELRAAVADPAMPGPANPQQNLGPQQLVPPPGQQNRRLRDPNRQVGAKKAKSLARRERVRAYHEFMREQGDIQRAQEASVAGEREKELAEARAKRKEAEREIEEREKRKREERKLAEQQRDDDERNAVVTTIAMVTDGLRDHGRIELCVVAQTIGRDVAWIEKVIRKEGILGLKKTEHGQVMTMLTSKGWFVTVTEADMRQLKSEALSYQGATPSKVTWTEMGCILDGILRKQRVHS